MNNQNIKHFVNLTNGIEKIPQLSNFSFIRIQSTTLERKNYYKLFADLDNNFLMWLALGKECIVYDFGTNRPLSKTIYLGLPIIEYCLNKFWFNYEQNKVFVGKNYKTECKQYIEKEIYQKYFVYHSEKKLEAKIWLSIKLKYYKKYLIGNKINLKGISSSTTHDSDITFFKNILKNI
jgi:hypothetical protein